MNGVINAVNALNKINEEVVDDPEIATRISQYEMAFKMQASVPELTDLSKEAPVDEDNRLSAEAMPASPPKSTLHTSS